MIVSKRNPQARRFAEVPGTRRPRPDQEHLKALLDGPREPCPECGTTAPSGIHVAGCPKEFGY